MPTLRPRAPGGLRPRPAGHRSPGTDRRTPTTSTGTDQGFAPDTLADLDDDGFPDFVTTVEDEGEKGREDQPRRATPYVTWGGPNGPEAEGDASPVRLPRSAAELGVEDVVRGDFIGDGHHDLAARARTQTSLDGASLVVLYGPFTRSGEPTRMHDQVPLSEGELPADDIDPSGRPRATSVLLHQTDDGEQSGNLLHQARRCHDLSPISKELRAGDAHAFGDFDGDGRRDVAVGDDGGRSHEPGYGKEPADVAGSLTVRPGSGGSPVTHRLPEAPEGAATDYGPGGFTAADPDGDGRDGILVATYEGATPIDGDERVTFGRNVKKGPASWRHARPAGAGDFDTTTRTS